MLTCQLPVIYKIDMSIVLNIDVIEKKRIELGLTKQELARRAGISPGRYTQIIDEARSGRPAFAPTTKELATALGLSVSDIVIDGNAA